MHEMLIVVAWVAAFAVVVVVVPSAVFVVVVAAAEVVVVAAAAVVTRPVSCSSMHLQRMVFAVWTVAVPQQVVGVVEVAPSQCGELSRGI